MRAFGAWALMLACAPLLGLLVIVLWIAVLFKAAWFAIRGKELDMTWWNEGVHRGR